MCPNPQFPADLVTFTEEIDNGKLPFLCSVYDPSRMLDFIHEFTVIFKICITASRDWYNGEPYIIKPP